MCTCFILNFKRHRPFVSAPLEKFCVKLLANFSFFFCVCDLLLEKSASSAVSFAPRIAESSNTEKHFVCAVCLCWQHTLIESDPIR